MSQYNNIFISREDFLDYKAKGIPFTGFVIGEGYAFVQYQEYHEDMDGTVMDQGDGVSFSLSSLIPGFTYAVEAMNVGDSVRAYIPPELGYGEMGTQTIEPNSLLIFDITLNSIETPSEN